MKTALILPVESQVRELDAKLLLGCVAAERGFRVIVGSRNHIGYRAASLPRGVYLAKGGRSQQRLFKILWRLGHEIALLDEEAIVRVEDPGVWDRRFGAGALELVSHLFAWGDDDAELLRRYASSAERAIHVTGNPRVDLTRPELRRFFAPDVDRIRERFGDFALLNTNFAGINHLLPALREERIAVEAPHAVEMTPFLRDFAAHRMRLFSGFVDAVPLLGRALAPRALVVRPHPAEDAALWRRAAGGLSNVHVIQGGNVVPWLLAARAVAANNCTTLVEARLLDTPGIHFQPFADERLDMLLPRRVSWAADSVDALVVLFRRALERELAPTDAAGEGPLRKHVAALDGPLASDRIVDVLVAQRERVSPHPGAASWLRGAAEALKRRFDKQREASSGEHAHSDMLHKLRFPELAIEEVSSRVSQLAALTGRFASVRVRRRWPHVFELSTS